MTKKEFAKRIRRDLGESRFTSLRIAGYFIRHYNYIDGYWVKKADK